MATDYDAPRKNDDEPEADSIEELTSRQKDQSSAAIEEDENEAAEGFEPADHLAIGEGLDIIDTRRGAKVSGARFYYLKGWGMRLELALMTAALDAAVAHGFTPMTTPTLVTPQVMGGNGFPGAPPAGAGAAGAPGWWCAPRPPSGPSGARSSCRPTTSGPSASATC